MVSARSLISKIFNLFTKPLGIVPNAPFKIGITVNIMFHSFLSSLPRSKFSSLFSFFVHFHWVLCRSGKIHKSEGSLFLLTISFYSLRVFHIIVSWWFSTGVLVTASLLKSPRFFTVFRPISTMLEFGQSPSVPLLLLCIYHLFVWSNFNFLHNSQWITLLTQSCLVLYSFCVNLLHLLIMWSTISSLSPHNLHLLFCCVLSILTLIWLVLTALFVLLLEEIQFLY